MDGNCLEFVAMQGMQARKAFYIIMVPLKFVPQFFKFDDNSLPPSLRAQRTLNNYRWSHEDYERAIRKAGFSDYHWQRPLISQANRQKFPEGYWGDFERNCLQTGLVCTL